MQFDLIRACSLGSHQFDMHKHAVADLVYIARLSEYIAVKFVYKVVGLLMFL